MRQIVALRGRSARGSIDERRRFRGDRPANPAIVSEPITAKLGAERPLGAMVWASVSVAAGSSRGNRSSRPFVAQRDLPLCDATAEQDRVRRRQR
jgi:hypothetical protein